MSNINPICLRRKISRYSPSEPAKIYEKAIQRHAVADFQPKSIVAIIRELDERQREVAATTASQNAADQQDKEEKQKAELVQRYLDVSNGDFGSGGKSVVLIRIICA